MTAEREVSMEAIILGFFLSMLALGLVLMALTLPLRMP